MYWSNLNFFIRKSVNHSNKLINQLWKKILLALLAFQSFTLIAQNVITNGNIESWTNATTLDNWTTNNDVSQNTVDTAEGNSSAALTIENNVLEPEIVTTIPLVAGLEYMISFKYKYLDINLGQDHPIVLKVVRNGSATTLSANTVATNNLWTEAVQTFTPDQTGDYNLSLSLATLDNASFRVLIDDVKAQDAILNVKDSALNAVSVYPTITSNFITLNNTETIKNIKASVFNVNGAQLKTVALNNNKLDFSNLSSGLYFVRIESNTASITKKIIRK